MSRGKAGFSTMDIAVEMKPGREPCRADRADQLPKRFGDPMRNLLDRDMIQKESTRQSPPINNGAKTMRGNAEFVTMKGFGDYEMKGSATESTAEQARGKDVAKDEALADKAKKKSPPKGGIRVSDDDLTMSDDLETVAEGSAKDTADTYVSDIQGEKIGKKGYEAYNEMCCKGMTADLNINPYDVAGSMAQIAESAETVCKELDGGIEVKGPKWDATKAGVKTATDWAKGKAKAAIGAPGKAAERVGEEVRKRVEPKVSKLHSIGEGPGTTPLAPGGEAMFPKGKRQAAADFIGRNKKKVGGAVIGAGALGVGGAGYGGARALSGDKEEKGFLAEKKSLVE